MKEDLTGKPQNARLRAPHAKPLAMSPHSLRLLYRAKSSGQLNEECLATKRKGARHWAARPELFDTDGLLTVKMVCGTGADHPSIIIVSLGAIMRSKILFGFIEEIP